MKNKFVLAGMMIIAAAILFKAGMILGQSSEVITSVCKTNGGVLVSRENCPSGMTPVAIGGETSGNAIGSGYVRFMNIDKILTEDGFVWVYKEYDFDGDGLVESDAWIKDPEIIQLDPSIVDQIVFWSTNYFITNDNSFYVLRFINPYINGGFNPTQWVKVSDLPVGF